VTAGERRDASLPKRPRHHQGKLFLPERVAVRPGPLIHDNIRTCVAQRVRSPRHRTPRCGQGAARPRNAPAPTGVRPRRRTSRARRTVPGQSPVSTHGAAASHQISGDRHCRHLPVSSGSPVRWGEGGGFFAADPVARAGRHIDIARIALRCAENPQLPSQPTTLSTAGSGAGRTQRPYPYAASIRCWGAVRLRRGRMAVIHTVAGRPR